MATGRVKLYFFLDQNVPDSIAKYLQKRGHSAYRLRHHIPDNSPDAAVAMTALQANRILVSVDKDFNSQRFQQDRFAKLSRIGLSGPGPSLKDAMKEHIEVIEFYMTRQPKRTGIVAHIKVGQVRFRTK